MAKKPFIYVDTVVLAGNGSGTWSVNIGAGETARFRRMIYASTGAFSITGFRDSSNNPFANAAPNEPLRSTVLAKVTDNSEGISRFEPTIDIVGPRSLNIDLLDTSGAGNTVTLAFEAELETGV